MGGGGGRGGGRGEEVTKAAPAASTDIPKLREKSRLVLLGCVVFKASPQSWISGQDFMIAVARYRGDHAYFHVIKMS